MSRLAHRFDLEALAEYEEAARNHADQQPGLDLRFIACIEDAIALICEAPERWRVFAGREVRRALTRVFPYGILDTIEPNHVLVVAVAHYSREPGYWQHRLPWSRRSTTRSSEQGLASGLVPSVMPLFASLCR